MPKHLVCPDVSEFQRPLDHTYTRDFVIFRVTFGAHYLDPKFLANANAAKRLHAQGRLAGVLLYVVYTNDSVQAQYDATWRAIGPDIPPWLTGIMIDVETWRGKSYHLSGDHSRRLNRLYGMHAHRLGSWNSVIAYGNAGDLHELYPGRDKRCRVIVASYGSDLSYRKVHGAIGQQYSDGQARYPVPRVGRRELPRASAPFGHCDHNVFPGLRSGRDLVALLRPDQLHPAPRRARKPVAKPPRKPVVKAPHQPVTKAQHKPPAKAPRPPAAVPHKPAVTANAVTTKATTTKATTTKATTTTPPTAALPTTVVVRNDTLISRNGSHSLVLHDDGTLEIRHRIDTNIVTAGEH